MSAAEETAIAIINAYDDHYMDKAKRNIFEGLFANYLPLVDPAGSMEAYDSLVLLADRHRAEFDLIVSELKRLSLL